MKTKNLKSKILKSFLLVILILGISVSVFGTYVINKDIIERAQKQVQNDLKVATLVYNYELDVMRNTFAVIRYITNSEELRIRLGLDYLYIVNVSAKDSVKSEIVLRAFSGEGTGGTRLINKEELQSMGGDVYRKSEIGVRYTQKARPSELKVLEKALAIEYAKPVFDAEGRVTDVLYGGKIINRAFALVDGIRDSVFENRMYDGKPVVTVTIFLDDTRIATNVLDDEGKRAIGTRVSQTVYENVVEKGKSWVDRAFVVTDWYLTAYQPIRAIDEKIIGILYVGILEKPFIDLKRNIFLAFLAIILLGVALATVVSFILDEAITRPFENMIEATNKLSSGDLDHRIEEETQISELNRLARSFNEMAGKLDERDKRLNDTNEKLAALNKSYLDLVGFVSHELKGILGSIVMNIYSLKEGFLGALNEKQQKAVDSSARSLDHFENMVKNYLDLSRIEKGEMEVNKTDVDLCDNLIKPAIENFEKQGSEKKIRIENSVPAGVRLKADRNLLMIVFNNLLSNAIKYGLPGGRISIGSENGDERFLKVSFL